MGFGTSEGEHCGGVRYLEYLKKGDSKKGVWSTREREL